ncbi:MAG: amidohydrolase family protein [Gemmatimonadales bacterium]|nr:amidohydrolase family protein [Gemmatimonadales bacterium]
MQASARSPEIGKLRLFDSCVTLGRMAMAEMPEWLTPSNVVEVMDKYDVAEALVHSNDARLRHPRAAGNRQLLTDIAAIPRLHPVWVLEPPESAPPKAAQAMVEEMVAAGVKAARLMMGFAPPLPWLWEATCASLEEHRVPCFLDFAPTASGSHGNTQGVPDAASIHHLHDLCLAHPQLPMIISHAFGGVGISQPTLPLMRRVPNLHLDITCLLDYWKRAVVELGPERVFFATGMPFDDPSWRVSNVQYAHEIDGAAKRQICGDNLRRLMEAVR